MSEWLNRVLFLDPRRRGLTGKAAFFMEGQETRDTQCCTMLRRNPGAFYLGTCPGSTLYTDGHSHRLRGGSEGAQCCDLSDFTSLLRKATPTDSTGHVYPLGCAIANEILRCTHLHSYNHVRPVHYQTIW